ncbi:MAG: MFS transporter [archaeon]
MHDETKQKVKKSLLFSIVDGTFYSSMIGFGESFLQAFAVLLKATSFQLGLLAALPTFFSSLFQLGASKFIKIFGSRKKLVVTCAFLEGFMYIPIALSFYFGEMSFNILLLFVTLYWIVGRIISPAWNSWMGDLVREKDRGKYFGRRLRITGIATFVTFIFGGYILQEMSDLSLRYYGFAIIFALAFISRLISISFLVKQYEPEYKPEERKFRIHQFISNAEFSEPRKLSIYLNLMGFAVNVAAPFFAAYMLYDLKMDYLSFTLINAASILIKFVAMPLWGRVCDRFGNRKVLSLASYLIPIIPLLWLFSHNLYYLIAIQFFSGFVWAAWDISSFDYLYDVTNQENRTRIVAYNNVLGGIASLIGPIVGAIILHKFSPFWSDYFFIFVVSAVLRMLVAWRFVPTLKEIRKVKPITFHRLFFNVLTTMPNSGIMHDIITFSKALKVGTKRRRNL